MFSLFTNAGFSTSFLSTIEKFYRILQPQMFCTLPNPPAGSKIHLLFHLHMYKERTLDTFITELQFTAFKSFAER